MAELYAQEGGLGAEILNAEGRSCMGTTTTSRDGASGWRPRTLQISLGGVPRCRLTGHSHFIHDVVLSLVKKKYQKLIVALSTEHFQLLDFPIFGVLLAT
ncbi:hypothetical protein L484_008977 [Morus notabilis]|uniref:Uncharacterized protein n=1 Tax=Morus notabilis TaxID=981085 RepID=W9R0T0_9ROSA|nr:hypothetical protein L484_008977 [Morus notabilis]